MPSYIYSADEFCEQCGEKIIAAITAEGHAPADPSDESSFDSDEFPKYVGEHDGSSDCPGNCADCHRPLNNSLTPAGVEYVIDAILESINEGEEARNAVHDEHSQPNDYYKGSRTCEVVRDWAQDLKDSYGLDAKDEFIVNHYLELTAPKVSA